LFGYLKHANIKLIQLLSYHKWVIEFSVLQPYAVTSMVGMFVNSFPETEGNEDKDEEKLGIQSFCNYGAAGCIASRSAGRPGATISWRSTGS
jgi:hypothetical protein